MFSPQRHIAFELFGFVSGLQIVRFSLVFFHMHKRGVSICFGKAVSSVENCLITSIFLLSCQQFAQLFYISLKLCFSMSASVYERCCHATLSLSSNSSSFVHRIPYVRDNATVTSFSFRVHAVQIYWCFSSRRNCIYWRWLRSWSHPQTDAHI